MVLRKNFRQISTLVLMVAALQAGFSATAQTSNNLDSALTVARQWGGLADPSQASKMWDAGGPLMKSTITGTNWKKYVGDLNQQFGTGSKREWVQMIRITDPQSLPKGEYLNVVFFTQFGRAPALETISLAMSNGRWAPVGYVIKKIPEQTEAAGMPASPAASDGVVVK